MKDFKTIFQESEFSKKVQKGLSLCGVDLYKVAKKGAAIGAAVSGGADSISLLYSLCSILKDFPITLEVITVNHNIRPYEETYGDADFVFKCCNRLKSVGANINCTVVELKPGLVVDLAHSRQGGIEESARFLRYNAFEKFIKEKNIDYLCLAHNKNDHIETILMRFLQGATLEAASGISLKRDKYIRPLLEISRGEIEDYLNFLGSSWREDKTNCDTNYFRNNIRVNLIPFLNEHFDGWEKSILTGAEKAGEDAEVIQKNVLEFPMVVGRGKGDVISHVSFKISDFEKENIGIKKRILIKACNLIGENGRIPNSFLMDFINCQKGEKIFHNTEISVKKDLIFVKKLNKKVTDSVFFDIIEESGVYDFPFGKLSVTFNSSGVYFSINGCESFVNTSFPICIRSVLPGDEIRNSNGGMKKVVDVFSDWHVDDAHRKLIPIVYNLKNGTENLLCILGSFLGYKDWIVK